MRDHTQRCGRISRRLRTAGRLLLVAVLAPLCRMTLAAEAQSNDAWTFHLLYQFKAGAGGAEPYATPIIDSKGNLYSTTCNDGAFASGVVWKLSPAGKETVLYNFKQTGGGGGMPYSSLIMDAAGNVYGTTQFRGIYGGPCGALGCGTVFKVDPSGKETVLHRFTGKANDGMTSEQGLVADPAGSLYGTTIRGGANGIGVIFKIDPSGKWTILHSFDFNVEGFFPYGGTLLRDAAGNLYGTTEVGGSGGGLRNSFQARSQRKSDRAPRLQQFWGRGESNRKPGSRCRRQLLWRDQLRRSIRLRNGIQDRRQRSRDGPLQFWGNKGRWCESRRRLGA